MENLSKLTGELLEDGKKDFDLRKMCLNCSFLQKNKDGEFVCRNEDNMKLAMEPVYEAIKKVNAYNVVSLEVEPVPLKKPTNRCGNWNLSDDIVEYMKTLFV